LKVTETKVSVASVGKVTTYTISYTIALNCATLEMQTIVSLEITVGYSIPDNKEIHPTGKARFDNIDNLCLDP
jgi:hypothetical protein